MPVTIATLLDIARGMAFVHSKSTTWLQTGKLVRPCTYSLHCSEHSGKLNRYAVNGRALPTQVCHGSLKQADYRILNFEPIYARDIGTITHMPPELMDPVLMPAADVWAFGIIAWEAVEAFHGKCCYQGKNPGQVPEDFGALIKKCPGRVISFWGA
ncbi:hypothetical protein AK812_SmicGene19063 [Symbiodinium microadriaticum]|uniref:Protein kinase domain-containing protein n=1 Tax=Symbiodinium microadriaticum TaxID=2951 RepID=A0A1Q9DTH4_SYMMI|nr:hypothetical protein AK812_SmicGene19063 [Symbiodinium microadriaticum]